MRSYGVLNEKTQIALRSFFLIDPRKRPVNRTFPPPPGSRTMDAIVAAPGGDTWRRRECVKFP